MRISAAHKAQKEAAAQGVMTAQQPVSANTGADLLLKEFAAVMDKIAARSDGEPSAEQSFYDALQVGGEIELSRIQPMQPVQEPQLHTNQKLGDSSAEGDVAGDFNQDASKFPQRDSNANPSFADVNEQAASRNSEDRTLMQTAASQTETSASNSETTVRTAQLATEAVLPEDAAQEALEGSALPDPSLLETEAGPVNTMTAKSLNSNTSGSKSTLDSLQPANTQADSASNTSVPPDGQSSQNIFGKSLADIQIGELGSSEVKPISAPVSPDVARMTIEVLALKYALERSMASGLTALNNTGSNVETKASEIAPINAVMPSASSRQNGSDGANGARLQGQAAREEIARPARPLSPVQSTRTLEKVEQALKEASKARDGKTISLRLDPPDLGKVKVDVSLRDGALHARIVVESPAVSQLMRERSHDLQQNLRSLGLNVDTISVSIGSEGQSSFDMGQFVRQEMGEYSGPAEGDMGRMGSVVGAVQVKGETAVVQEGWVA
jgi:flagellar hook-length control protein FliK